MLLHPCGFSVCVYVCVCYVSVFLLTNNLSAIVGFYMAQRSLANCKVLSSKHTSALHACGQAHACYTETRVGAIGNTINTLTTIHTHTPYSHKNTNVCRWTDAINMAAHKHIHTQPNICALSGIRTIIQVLTNR